MKKFCILVIGVALMAFGTSQCNITGLGIDPFNALCVAFSDIFSIQLGTMVLFLQLIIGVFVFLTDKKWLGFGSLAPMILFGYFLQFFNWLNSLYLSVNDSFILNFFVFLIGMFIIAIGMSTYMECEVGMVPYDCLSFVIGGWVKKNPFIFRIFIDTTVALIAYILGGPISIGTILLALLTGPLINLIRKKVTYRLFLTKK